MTNFSPGAPSGAPLEQTAYAANGSVVGGGYIDVLTLDEPVVGIDLEGGGRPARPNVVVRHAGELLVGIADALSAVAALAVGGTIEHLGVSPLLAGVLGSAVWVALLRAFGARAMGAQTIRAVLGAGGAAGVLLVLAGARPGAGSLLITVAILVALALVVRVARARSERAARAEGSLRLRTAVVAATEGTAALDGVLGGDTDMSPIVLIDAASSVGGGRAPRHHAIPIADGDLEAVPRIIADMGIECLLVVGTLAHPQLETLRRAARRAGAEFRVAVAIPAVPSGGITTASTGRAAVVSVAGPRTPVAFVVKRMMDVAIASLLIVLTLPLLTAIALTVKATSRGPITFRQLRATQGGRPFQILKFRTMDERRDADVAASTAQPFFKLEDDPRLTPIGRVIRRLSLDELPQLWNVVRGDMSLVGPRPLPIEQVDAHPQLLRPRNDVRAGMTGWWQVNGRSDLPPEEAVGYDLYYIENWSLGLDLRILARTVPAIFSRRGAY